MIIEFNFNTFIEVTFYTHNVKGNSILIIILRLTIFLLYKFNIVPIYYLGTFIIKQTYIITSYDLSASLYL